MPWLFLWLLLFCATHVDDDILQPLDAKKFGPVQQVIRHNMAYNCQPPVLSSMSLVKAPLATPEPIEFGDYAQVKVRSDEVATR